MSRETEKFNRALQKFLDDNPDIDFDKAKEEFINMYNSGEYKLDDDFSKAEELYSEALKLDDPKLVKDAIKKALEIYPKHYEAKGELIMLEAKNNQEKISRLNSLLNEIKDDLEKNKEIDFYNFERTLWLNIDARPYLRNLFKLMLAYDEEQKYEDALEVGKELIRLDPENHQDQTMFYLKFLLCLKKYDAAINDAAEFFKIRKQSKYLFVPFLANIYKNDNQEVLKYAKELAKYNISYLCMIIGVANLTAEDYESILDNPYVAEDSFEEAARLFFVYSSLIFNNMDDVNRFAEELGGDIIKLIDASPKGMELLFIFETERELSFEQVVKNIKSLHKEMDFAKLKDLSNDDIKKELIKLKNKKYIEYHDSKYFMTYLGHTVLQFFVGDEEDENY